MPATLESSNGADSPLPKAKERKVMDKFYEWLVSAANNDRFVYYTGDLGRDRSSFGGGFKTQKQMEAGLIGRAAWNAYEQGLIDLIRRRVGRLGDGMFEYIAVRVRREGDRKRVSAIKPARKGALCTT